MTLIRLKQETLNILLLLFLCFSIYGCSTPPVHLLNNDQAFNSTPLIFDDYKLMPGDQIDIKFFYHPELNESVVIRPDGKFSIPLAEEILVTGITVKELDDILTEKYASELIIPEVTVIVTKFDQRSYFISGEVEFSGEKAFKRSLTILQVLAGAGGLKDTAADSSILLIRSNSDNKPIFISIDYDALLSNPYNNFYLRPYDVIFVSKSFIADVGLFIDQYINKIVPKSLGFSFLYTLGTGAGAGAGAIF